MTSTIQTRGWKKANPMRYAYQTNKDNAKRRGIFWDLTYEEFAEFAYEFDYLDRKGRTKTCWSVDRIIPELGYTKGNLQILTVGDNSRKRHKRIVYSPCEKKSRLIDIPDTAPEDLPF